MDKFIETQTVYFFNVQAICSKYQVGDAVFVKHITRGWIKVCFITSIKKEGVFLSYYNSVTDDYVDVYVNPEEIYYKKVIFSTINYPESFDKV